MTPQLPAQREYRHKQELVDKVLASSHPAERVRPAARWGVPVLAAACVAAVALAVLLVSRDSTGPDPAGQSAGTVRPEEVALDLGPLTAAEVKAFSKRCRFWNGVGQEVLHARKVRSGWGDGVVWSMALRGRQGNSATGVPAGEGRLTACTGRPGSTGEVQVENFLTTVGRARYDDGLRAEEGFMLKAQPDKKFAADRWVKVPGWVKQVRVRLVLNGKPEQWFSSRPVDDLSYVQTWIDAPIRESDRFELQVQFLDDRGKGRLTVLKHHGNQLNKLYPMKDYYLQGR